MGGQPGAAGGSSGGGLPTFPGSNAMYPNFDNAFMLTQCMGGTNGYDCPNLPGGGACNTTDWAYTAGGMMVQTAEDIGTTYTEAFTVTGGDPTKVYAVTVRVRGQAEGRIYTGGVRPEGAAAVDPTATVNNMLWIGGRPGTSRVDYNAFVLTINPPAGGTPIPGATAGAAPAPTFYAFNATAAALEGLHYNYAVDETFTMRVKTGFTITLISHDSNCIAIRNCGPGGPYTFGTPALCAAVARATPTDITLPANFGGMTITSPQRFQTQFLNFKVMSVVAE